ncbi:BamA/TamA family outer membrane protein, partial [Pectobacterium brasiliense]|uniref:BamA/TamA family outer membrane protein n=1 Tax=Pectobacterium brasiliense TaxID=180957 RepID=UPI00196993D1
PLDSYVKVNGASLLSTGSIEYQYNVTVKWWGGVFVDSGEGLIDINRCNFKTGSGVGLRWASPIGPVNLDVAMAICYAEK